MKTWSAGVKYHPAVYLLLALAVVGVSVGGWRMAAADLPDVGQLDQITQFLGLMKEYISLNEQMYEVSSSSDRAACFALFQMKDIYEDSGRKGELAEQYRKLLGKVRSQTVRNLIRIQLAEILKDTGNANDAIQVLQEVIEQNGN